jgi:hypothetical protein
MLSTHKKQVNRLSNATCGHNKHVKQRAFSCPRPFAFALDDNNLLTSLSSDLTEMLKVMLFD